MANHLEKSSWALLVRGLATAVFGVIALAQPPVVTLVLTFVVFSLVDGIAGVVSSILSRKEGDRWWSAVLRGLAGIAPGVLALVQPAAGPLRLLHVMAARALVTGILDIIKALRLREEIEGVLLLIMSGLASVLFGLIAFVRPGAGALAASSLIAVYAISVGALLMALAFRMRGSGKKPDNLGAR